MRFDVANLRYLSKDDFRVLQALELGMRNHDLVPTTLIGAIAGLRHGGVHKILSGLIQNKLIQHEKQPFDGYTLTYPGYDYLALKALFSKGVISGVGRKIGVGKESDVYLACSPGGDLLVLKLERLGRTSFRAIKKKRDYMQHRKSASFLYMSRLAALKEFSFMTALRDAGFPTPQPVACNRHVIVMSLVPGVTLSKAHSLPHPEVTFKQCMDVVVRLAACGLVHCDFNQFNIMFVDPEADAAVASGKYRADVFGDDDEEEEGIHHHSHGAGESHAHAVWNPKSTTTGSDAEPARKPGAQKRSDQKLASGLENTRVADKQAADDKAAEARKKAAVAPAAASLPDLGTSRPTPEISVNAPMAVESIEDAEARRVAAAGRVVMIDFPQMVSTSHPNAEELFNRDVMCILQCFQRKFDYTPPRGSIPAFADIAKSSSLDVDIQASGYSNTSGFAVTGGDAGASAADLDAFEQLMGGYRTRGADTGGSGDDDDDDDDVESVEEGAEDEVGRTAAVGSAAGVAAGAGTASCTFVRDGEEFVTIAAQGPMDDDAGISAVGDAPSCNDAIVTSKEGAACALAVAQAKEEVGLADDGEHGRGLEVEGEAAGSDVTEEEDDEDGDFFRSSGGGARKGLSQEEIDALFDRPPQGTRTRPGGRRVKAAPGGEVYLREAAKRAKKPPTDSESAHDPSGDTAGARRHRPGCAASTIVDGEIDPDAVRQRVKSSFDKQKRKAELQAASAAGASGARSLMKDREKTRTRRMVKEVSGKGTATDDW